MSKLDKLRQEIINAGLDAVIVYDELNQRYLSDFLFSDGFLIITRSEAYLVTDFRYYEMALSMARSDFQVVMPKNRNDFISELFEKQGIRSVGFEGNSLSYGRYCDFVSKYPDVKFVDIGQMIENIRQIKTEEEIENIKRAQEITDSAFSHILKMLTPNMTELDVAAELEYFMKRNGSEGVAFDTIAVSGTASALPHGTPRNLKLQKGFLTMDFGAKYNGYCSDMTRTVVIGKADSEMKKLYSTVLKAQAAALDFLREGCDCHEADKIARDIIDAEYKGSFGHSLGHSVGLFIHEEPSLSSRFAGRKLRRGEIVTVEPGIYLFGKYGCRIEDMVEILDGGIYNFTHSEKELIEIL